MYGNLIVPFDGSASSDAVLPVAKDLARRCGARTVLVSEAPRRRRRSRQEARGEAPARRDDGIDLWVDRERSLGDAVLAAVRHRDDPLVCAGVRSSHGIVRRKATLDLVVADALVHAPAPVLVVGPQADGARQTRLQELVVSLDGSAESELILPLAVQWATELALALTLVGVVAVPIDRADAERRYLRDRLAQVAGDVPGAGYQLLEGREPGSALCAHLAGRAASVMMMSTHGRSGLDERPLGSVAQSVLAGSVRPVVLRRAVPPEVWAPGPTREVWLELPD